MSDDKKWVAMNVTDVPTSGTIDEVVAALLRLRDTAPEEHRAAVEIRFYAEREYVDWEEDRDAVLTVKSGYWRPLTDAEYEAQEAAKDAARMRALRSRERAAHQKQEAELATYRSLRAKYGDAP